MRERTFAADYSTDIEVLALALVQALLHRSQSSSDDIQTAGERMYVRRRSTTGVAAGWSFAGVDHASAVCTKLRSS